MRKCVKCDKETDIRLTVDLDIEGFPVCKRHVPELKADFTTAMLAEDDRIWDNFYKKYNVKDHRE